MFLTSSTFLAQKQSVYSKTFEINENATAFLKLSDGSVDVEIELSTDGKFHVDYDIDFKEYPKRKRDDILENIKVEAKMIDNHIMLSNESNSTYSSFSQKLLSGLYKRKQAKKTKYYQKSKDSLLKEIKENILPKSFYIDFIEKSGAWNEKQKKRSINKYNKRDKKRFQKRFTIKIPSNLKLKINAENTTVRINNNLSNQLSIRLDKGKIFVKSLKNKNNIIKIKDGVFIAEEIKGGKLTLDNVFKGQIGSLTNVNLDTEFSNLEIGEIKKNNHFKGFKNEIIFHNFSDNFDEFNFTSEYSKLHYFKTDNNFLLSANGYNTMVTINDKIKKIANQKNGEKKIFFETKTNKNGNSGKINLDIIHGFIYFH